MTAKDRDSIMNGATPVEAAHLLTRLESGQRAAYEVAQAEGTPAPRRRSPRPPRCTASAPKP
jgi:hypothetical protein